MHLFTPIEQNRVQKYNHPIRDGTEDWTRKCDYWCFRGYPHPIKEKS